MPRLVQSVSKYPKHWAGGQAVVTINRWDRYLGPHGAKASKLNYDRLINEWLSSGRPARCRCVTPSSARSLSIKTVTRTTTVRFRDEPSGNQQHRSRGRSECIASAYGADVDLSRLGRGC